MKNKIAIITTEYLTEFFKKTFLTIDLDCDISIYTYETFEDVPKLYDQFSADVDGILTSGIFPTQALKKGVHNINLPIATINVDEAALYRLLLGLLNQKRDLQFSRIYADPLELIHVDVTEFFHEDPISSYSNVLNPLVEDWDLPELIQMERLQFEKHYTLWKNQEVDICITRFSSIVEKLMKEGVNVHFSYPGIQYVKSTCVALINEIEMFRLKQHQPAAIYVSAADIISEKNNVILEETLAEYSHSYLLDYVIRPYHRGFEVLTEREKIESQTIGYHTCQLKLFLEERLSYSVCIGYGIGKDMYQARMNAMDANKESSLNQDNSAFLITENEVLLGPLNGALSYLKTAKWQPFKVTATEKIHLSPVTIRKVELAINSMPNKQITARELASKLSLAPRSAQRYLKELCNSGVLEVITQKRTTSKGRPERVYALCNT